MLSSENTHWKTQSSNLWKLRNAKKSRLNKKKKKYSNSYVKKFENDKKYIFSWDLYVEDCFIEDIDPIAMYKKADGLQVNLKQNEAGIVGNIKLSYNGFPVTWIVRPYWCRGIQ